MTGTVKIPFYGVNRQYASIREEILEVTDEVYKSGMMLSGSQTNMFEHSMAKYCNRKYAVTVNSGTQALIFALRALDVMDDKRLTVNPSNERRNKVLIPTQSFIATVNSVLEAGFDPVFCDVDPITGLIDINKINIEPDQLAAIMYVNLFGNVVDYDRLNTYNTLFNSTRIPIIEDAAQSFGSTYKGRPSGSLGDISILSFDPTKNLNNYGSGGMILTDSTDVYSLVLQLHNNGSPDHIRSGTNSKMSESDCAQMRVKLQHFEKWQARRKQIADYYRSELSGAVTKIPIEPDVEHSNHKFVIHYSSRHDLMKELELQGIETKMHYSIPLHIHDISPYDVGIFEGAEKFSSTCLSLPIYPELTDSEVEYIVDAVNNYTW